MARVVLDSSVLIALLSPNDLHHAAALKSTAAKHEYLLCALTLTEALIAPYRVGNSEGDQMLKAIKKSVNHIIDIDSEIAAHAAQLRANSKISLPDALMSATATLTNSQLWTSDKDLAKAHKGAVLIS